jgi:hypothetical protein
MKVLVQWALASPEDWVEIDSKLWSSLPQGPVPDDLNFDHIVTSQKRWIHALNVQGIIFMGFDHYAIEDIPDGILVTCWNDDTGDWVGDRHAEVWTILEPAFDAKINKINTRQTVEIFAENRERMIRYNDIKNCIGIYPWRSFEPPSNTVTRHGIWVSNELNDRLIAERSTHGWREWLAN